MFHRLLAPLDGSRLAESVLPVVQRLAKIVPCSVQLLHIIEKNAPSSVHGDAHLYEMNQAEAYLAAIGEELMGAGVEAATHVHTVPQGDVPRCIAEHADELEQDLIVLCSHGTGGVRRFVFGSNAEQVLAHGETPVLLVQPNEKGETPSFGPERILLLIDKSPATLPALSIGSELAGLSHARICLLASIPTLSSMSLEQAATGRLIPHTTRHVLDLAAEEASSYLQHEVDRLMARGVVATGKVERGDTAGAVVRTAHQMRADLVVLAARGLAGLGAFWADAVTRKVAGAYDGALLLIRRGKG